MTFAEMRKIIKDLDDIIAWVGTPFGYSYDEFYPPDLRDRVDRALAPNKTKKELPK